MLSACRLRRLHIPEQTSRSRANNPSASSHVASPPTQSIETRGNLRITAGHRRAAPRRVPRTRCRLLLCRPRVSCRPTAGAEQRLASHNAAWLGALASRGLWDWGRPPSKRGGWVHVCRYDMPSPRRGAPAAPPGASAEAATGRANDNPRCGARGRPGGARTRAVPNVASTLILAVAQLSIQPALAAPDNATSQRPVPLDRPAAAAPRIG
jgi:hypothetical protein